MSGERRDGDDAAGEAGGFAGAAGGAAGGFTGFAQLSQLAQLVSSLDAAGLVNGVGQAMAWARETVVAPHAAHADPAEHPECVICRGMAMVQSAAGPGEQAAAAAPGGGAPAQAGAGIRWVPVTRIDRPAAS